MEILNTLTNSNSSRTCTQLVLQEFSSFEAFLDFSPRTAANTIDKKLRVRKCLKLSRKSLAYWVNGKNICSQFETIKM